MKFSLKKIGIGALGMMLLLQAPAISDAGFGLRGGGSRGTSSAGRSRGFGGAFRSVASRGSFGRQSGRVSRVFRGSSRRSAWHRGLSRPNRFRNFQSYRHQPWVSRYRPASRWGRAYYGGYRSPWLSHGRYYGQRFNPGWYRSGRYGHYGYSGYYGRYRFNPAIGLSRYGQSYYSRYLGDGYPVSSNYESLDDDTRGLMQVDAEQGSDEPEEDESDVELQ